MKDYVVYILTNKVRGTLYIGFTNDLKRRIAEHKLEIADGFSKKYNLKRLVYVESFDFPDEAILREKRLKKWKRIWKINLIEKLNPEWDDLYGKFFVPIELDEQYKDWLLNRDIYKNISNND